MKVVVGLGVTGLSCVRYLKKRGDVVAVTDSRIEPPQAAVVRAEWPDVALHLGGFPSSLLFFAEEIIVSPGVALTEPFLQEAVRRRIPVIGDIELFCRHLAGSTEVPIVAITGSNAKSTVTDWLGYMAGVCGVDVAVGGNIGTPVLDLLMRPVIPAFYVLELSSFQLETVSSLRAAVAVILNITPDHMDRYLTFADYCAAKQRILQGARCVVVNQDDPATYPDPAVQLDADCVIARFSVAPVSEQRLSEGAVFERGLSERCLSERGLSERGLSERGLSERDVSDGMACVMPRMSARSIGHFFNLRSAPVSSGNPQGAEERQDGYSEDSGLFLSCDQEVWLPVDALQVFGQHNVANALAVLAIGQAMGLPKAGMLQALASYRGLPHRCQWVGDRQGVRWFNDSKGTNVGATVAALEGLGARLSAGQAESGRAKIVLIAGGVGKDADFSPLIDPVARYVRAVILIGVDAKQIAKQLQGVANTVVSFAATLQEAVLLAEQQAMPGDAVLLSPACASFDMFKNYEVRGCLFVEAFHALPLLPVEPLPMERVSQANETEKLSESVQVNV